MIKKFNTFIDESIHTLINEQNLHDDNFVIDHDKSLAQEFIKLLFEVDAFDYCFDSCKAILDFFNKIDSPRIHNLSDVFYNNIHLKKGAYEYFYNYVIPDALYKEICMYFDTHAIGFTVDIQHKLFSVIGVSGEF